MFHIVESNVEASGHRSNLFHDMISGRKQLLAIVAISIKQRLREAIMLLEDVRHHMVGILSSKFCLFCFPLPHQRQDFRFVDYPSKPLPKPIQTDADKKRIDKDDIGDHSNNPQDELLKYMKPVQVDGVQPGLRGCARC
jgi:hypothetical protein